MKVIHLRDQYLRVSFVYFLLKGFRQFEHWVACREIIHEDLKLYPYDKIIATSGWFAPTWLVDKILTVKLGLNSRPLNDWYAYYRLLKKDKKNILALHAHMGPQGYYALPLARKLDKRLFVTFYGSDMSDIPKLPGWMERYHQLFNTATAVIVEGEHMKSKMVELGCPANKVTVVRIGIPVEKLSFSYRKRPSARESLQILMCANFYPKKGYLKALKAIQMMVMNGKQLQVHIIGSGPQEEQLKLFVQENLQEQVIFYGPRTLPEIYELSTNMHVFFHPSETAPDGGSEGGAPTIILEMQALGLPVVATTHADIPNIIPRENHFLAGEYDIAGLVAQMDRLIETPDWNKIADAGRKFVEENHSNIVCAGKLEELYKLHQ